MAPGSSFGFDWKPMAKRSNKTVLFICTGNYYRIRFAEILFNHVAGKFGMSWQASSRGLALERGTANIGPMAVVAIKALETMGIRAKDDVAPGTISCVDREGRILGSR